MRKEKENICKFVTSDTSAGLDTVNFVYETECLSSGKTMVGKHNCVCLTVGGKGRVKTELGDYNISRGVIFFTFSGQPFVIYNEGDLEYMYISFGGNRATELFERYGITSLPSKCCIEGFESLISFWQSAISKAQSHNLDLISESVVLYTFSQLSHSSQVSVRHLAEEILRYIEANFSDGTLTLESCADDLGYNPKYISRVFAKHVGMTFSEHLKTTRINHAVFLMEQGITIVKNVALLSGFSDPLYFSKVFKQVLGITPSEFLASVTVKE